MCKSIERVLKYLNESPIKSDKNLSPTSRLIDFKNKRYESKRELAKKIVPDRSFERLLVYSNKPKLSLETSLKKLKSITRNSDKKKYKTTNSLLEQSLAKELLPALEETLEGMYEYYITIGKQFLMNL